MNKRLFFLLSMACAHYGNAIEHEPFFFSRTRLATVDTDEQNGRAASVLIRGGVDSSWSDALTSFIEIDHVASAWKDEHNNGVDRNDKPFIPDVDGTEINQLYLSYRQSSNRVYVGRRRIELDDQRFIGSNGFWQNDQTFDGVTFEREVLSASKIQYHYIVNANRIFGDDSAATVPMVNPNTPADNRAVPAGLLGDHEHKTHLLHARFGEWDYHEVTSFLYHVDNLDDVANAHKMAGFRYRFERHYGSVKPTLTVSKAIQQRLQSEKTRTSNYTLVEAGLGVSSMALSARYEHLEGNGEQAFIAPLGSLHDFHGWADRHNALPKSGLLDQSLRVNWRKKPWKIDARYHWFESSHTARKLGRELDVDILLKLSRHHRIALRFADYRAARRASGDQAPDEKRTFLSYSYER